MPRWLARTSCLLVFLILLAYAYHPLFYGGLARGAAAGFLHDDFRTLDQVDRGLHAEGGGLQIRRVERLFGIESVGGHPLAALSLELSAVLWSDRGLWSARTPLGPRLENLALLLCAAAGLWAFLRRVLWPWTGSEHANAAGAAAALLFALHPLNYASVGALAARGDLMGLALAFAAGAIFLRSRQERQYGFSVLAALLAILAGSCSDVALLLPLWLCGAELFSARRYRPLHVRARTALTTLVVFGACAGVDSLLRSWVHGRFELPRGVTAFSSIAGAGAWTGAANAFALAVEKLGVLVVPVNIARLGILGLMGGGVLLLLALQPALVAARSAPRLWGWFLFAWVVLIVLSESLQPLVRVHSDDWTSARVLLPGAAVMSVGLALAATALSDLRRKFLPLFLALGFAVLVHGNARPFAAAARAVEQLRSELAAARELRGPSTRLLLLDPPGIVRGVDVLAGALPWMLDPVFTAGGAEELAAQRGALANDGAESGPRSGIPFVRSIHREAFAALAREEEFARLRIDPLVLLIRKRELGGELAADDPSREALLLPPPSPTTGTRKWFREGGSPTMDLEALTSRAIHARAAPGTSTAEPPRLGWKAKGIPAREGVLAREGEHAGVWLELQGETLALFDMRASLPWLMGDRIRLVWPVEGWSDLLDAGVQDELPSFESPVAPLPGGADWRFARPRHVFVEAAADRGSWQLELLDLATFEWRGIVLEADEEGGLRAKGAAEQVLAWSRASGGAVAWSLEFRIDGVAVVRAAGR